MITTLDFQSNLGYEAWNSVTGLVEKKEWPIWANVLIGLLIGMAIIWIPLIWLLRFVLLVEMQCFDGRSH